jgi:hypothetical protein
MDYRVSDEHSLKHAPDEFIVHVPSQLVENVPANVPRALLPEYITDLILTLAANRENPVSPDSLTKTPSQPLSRNVVV